MKRSHVSFVVSVMLLICCMPVFCATLSSKNLVRVNLIKTTVITQADVDETKQSYLELYGQEVSDAEVLDALISDEIFSQALERDGFKLTEDQKDQLLASQKANIESQLGQALTDEDFAALVEYYNGIAIDKYRDSLALQYEMQSYVYTKKASLFEQAQMPTDADVQTFYKKNKSVFISAENVKLSHIFFIGDEDPEGARKKAEEVSAKIKKGEITFEKAVSTYSEDQASKTSAGEIGWLSIDDTENISYMGEGFFDSVFALDEGEVSDVILSNFGAHIVKVLVHNEAKFLELTDTISPTDTMTVSEYIYSYLYENLSNELFQKAYLEIINELKGEASIKYL